MLDAALADLEKRVSAKLQPPRPKYRAIRVNRYMMAQRKPQVRKMLQRPTSLLMRVKRANLPVVLKMQMARRQELAGEAESRIARRSVTMREVLVSLGTRSLRRTNKPGKKVKMLPVSTTIGTMLITLLKSLTGTAPPIVKGVEAVVTTVENATTTEMIETTTTTLMARLPHLATSLNLRLRLEETIKSQRIATCVITTKMMSIDRREVVMMRDVAAAEAATVVVAETVASMKTGKVVMILPATMQALIAAKMAEITAVDATKDRIVAEMVSTEAVMVNTEAVMVNTEAVMGHIEAVVAVINATISKIVRLLESLNTVQPI